MEGKYDFASVPIGLSEGKKGLSIFYSFLYFSRSHSYSYSYHPSSSQLVFFLLPSPSHLYISLFYFSFPLLSHLSSLFPFPSSLFSFSPSLTVDEVPLQRMLLSNPSAVRVSYSIDEAPLRILAADNYDIDIFKLGPSFT